jgi:hypothetical protein
VFLVIAFDSGFIGVTTVNRDRLGEPVTADRFLEKLQRRLFVPLLGAQKVDGLALLVHSTIEILPLAFDFHVGLVHTPAASFLRNEGGQSLGRKVR